MILTHLTTEQNLQVFAQMSGQGIARADQPTIDQLKARGYEVEDMGKEWGAEFAGQYRWVRGDDFQDFDTSDCEADAWALAKQHAGV